jgi:DNA-binding NarL/FixJ family response regulator
MRKSKDKIKVIIVDDNTVFRNTLKKFLQDEFKYVIVGEASGGEDFFALPNVNASDVILMDLQMPEMDGYAITKKLLIDHRDIPVVAITMHSEKAYLQELICVGFKGCVLKPEIYNNIHEAIVEVTNKGYYFPKGIKI